MSQEKKQPTKSNQSSPEAETTKVANYPVSRGARIKSDYVNLKDYEIPEAVVKKIKKMTNASSVSKITISRYVIETKNENAKQNKLESKKGADENHVAAFQSVAVDGEKIANITVKNKGDNTQKATKKIATSPKKSTPKSQVKKEVNKQKKSPIKKEPSFASKPSAAPKKASPKDIVSWLKNNIVDHSDKPRGPVVSSHMIKAKPKKVQPPKKLVKPISKKPISEKMPISKPIQHKVVVEQHGDEQKNLSTQEINVATKELAKAKEIKQDKQTRQPQPVAARSRGPIVSTRKATTPSKKSKPKSAPTQSQDNSVESQMAPPPRRTIVPQPIIRERQTVVTQPTTSRPSIYQKPSITSPQVAERRAMTSKSPSQIMVLIRDNFLSSIIIFAILALAIFCMVWFFWP